MSLSLAPDLSVYSDLDELSPEEFAYLQGMYVASVAAALNPNPWVRSPFNVAALDVEEGVDLALEEMNASRKGAHRKILWDRVR